MENVETDLKLSDLMWFATQAMSVDVNSMHFIISSSPDGSPDSSDPLGGLGSAVTPVGSVVVTPPPVVPAS